MANKMTHKVVLWYPHSCTYTYPCTHRGIHARAHTDTHIRDIHTHTMEFYSVVKKSEIMLILENGWDWRSERLVLALSAWTKCFLVIFRALKVKGPNCLEDEKRQHLDSFWYFDRCREAMEHLWTRRPLSQTLQPTHKLPPHLHSLLVTELSYLSLSTPTGYSGSYTDTTASHELPTSLSPDAQEITVCFPLLIQYENPSQNGHRQEYN